MDHAVEHQSPVFFAGEDEPTEEFEPLLSELRALLQFLEGDGHVSKMLASDAELETVFRNIREFFADT